MKVLDRNGKELTIGAEVTGRRGVGIVKRIGFAGAQPTIWIDRAASHPFPYVLTQDGEVYRAPFLELVEAGEGR